MPQFSEVLGVVYRLLIVGLALYGLHNLATTILFLIKKSKPVQKTALPTVRDWPPVTIQLPIFNEKYTVERLLKSVTQLDYPADRLQIQVLDDSTDDTAELVNRLVAEYKASGINIELLQRENRKGYKAGAMSEGLRSATGEFIGIFDADFLPNPDWLKNTVPFFHEPELGCLQTRWGHTNRNYNLLTQAEALAIDGHFVVEQTARSGNNLFLNFNGTAGLWRRSCIEDAGGWQWDTMTEDLDLSYRAQMRGWKISYHPDVVVPAELPSDVEAFKKQQSRWARGCFQVVRKLLPDLIQQKGVPWYVRLAAVLHITGYIVHPLVLSLLLLALPVGLLEPSAFEALPISVVACFGPPAMYLATNASLKLPWKERLKMLPLLTVVGFGLSLSTSIGVIEGMTGKKAGDWVVTPKMNLSDVSRKNKSTPRTEWKPFSKLVWVEIFLALYAFVVLLVLTPSLGWGMIPWMALYILGYLYIAGLNVIQHRPGTFRKKKNIKKEELHIQYINNSLSEKYALGGVFAAEEGWSNLCLESKSKGYLKSIEELGGENRVF
jgi:cellulose synthase/poly-beta-1,6-N-acetylglucosamine synthase-like glycosyltransferase